MFRRRKETGMKATNKMDGRGRQEKKREKAEVETEKGGQKTRRRQ